MRALEVDHLKKSYLRNIVLDDISFAVEKGEFFGLAGVNGAGKSTFLKCLFDFCHYEGGEIKIFGVSAKRRAARAPISFLPERFVPPYYLNGGDFLRLMLKLQALPYSPQAAQEMAETLDLEPAALKRPVRSYSKGMTQKLGLTACFLAQKDFYIMDEPMSGLDPKARALVKHYFRKLRERGVTLFFTSHALADIEEVCGKMAVLHEGGIKFIGTPAQMHERYSKTGTLEEAYLECIRGKEAA
jgi:ABC-2 type transport system ATP-binding protein